MNRLISGLRFQVSCLLLAALLAASACTVAPVAVKPAAAGFGDDGKQTSGLIAFVEGGALIDAGARDRYNALIKLYGRDWQPAIKADHGITRREGLWFITNSALQQFIVMSDWKRMGRIPK